MGHKNEAAGTEKDRAANGSKNKWRTALKVSSVLLLILCFVELVLCALSAMGLYAMFSDEVLVGLLSEDGVDEGSLVLVLSVSLAIMVADPSFKRSLLLSECVPSRASHARKAARS